MSMYTEGRIIGAAVCQHGNSVVDAELFYLGTLQLEFVIDAMCMRFV